MIENATLLRLDSEEEIEGDSISVRCALTPLTAEQERTSRSAAWNSSAVIYIPLRTAPSPGAVVGGRALVRPDGETAPVLYTIKEILSRAGQTLGHVQIYLTPIEE